MTLLLELMKGVDFRQLYVLLCVIYKQSLTYLFSYMNCQFVFVMKRVLY